jgi:hypothetical protein
VRCFYTVVRKTFRGRFVGERPEVYADHDGARPRSLIVVSRTGDCSCATHTMR